VDFIEYDIDMQTFLISPDYSETSKILDYRRLGKQRVECWQILNILLTLKIHPNTKLAWMNHPAVLMWKGYEYQLCKYGIEICKNWINRGYKDSMLPKFQSWLRRMNYFDKQYPKWFKNKKFFLSHKSNLIRKFPEYYRPFWPKVSDNLPYVWPL